MDKIVYVYNNKTVTEEEFYSEMNKYPEEEVAKIKKLLEENGQARIESLTKKKNKYSYNYNYFYKALQVVFDMEEIIAQNEYDPLDDDAFNCAWALYKNGYGKVN